MQNDQKKLVIVDGAQLEEVLNMMGDSNARFVDKTVAVANLISSAKPYVEPEQKRDVSVKEGESK